MKILREVRLLTQHWARRYGGYYEHMNQEHPFIGYLDWGDVRFKVKHATFSNGRMHVTAEAGTSEAGVVTGHVTLLGTDEKPVMTGTQDNYMGTKTAASTWGFKWDVRLPGQSADDTPEAPDAPPA